MTATEARKKVFENLKDTKMTNEYYKIKNLITEAVNNSELSMSFEGEIESAIVKKVLMSEGYKITLSCLIGKLFTRISW